MYKYRFKTEEEFEKEFGEDWCSLIESGWNDAGHMNYLLGIDYPYEILTINSYLKTVDGWCISKDMLIKKQLIPSYEPRKLDRTI